MTFTTKIRVVAPVAGLTTPVWAMLISTALAGSAVGYYLGGMLADRLPKAKLHFIFLMGASLSLVAVPYLRAGVALLLKGASPLMVTALTTAALFAVPIVCLAALTTYIIRLHVQSLQTVAQVHGDFFAWATIGSVVGTFMTTYLLIPMLTISDIFLALGGFVALAGFLAIKTDEY